MSTYAKLFSSIVHSTIWREANHVRLVWITILALKDKDGIVEASVPGLADVARVTLSECEEALEKLMGPDKYSRTKDYDGRRIAEVPGGWRVLNHHLHRDGEPIDRRRGQDAARAKSYRERKKQQEPCERHVTSRDFSVSDTDQIQIRPDQKEDCASVTQRAIPDTDHARLIEHYCLTFESVRGERPAFDGRGAKQISGMLKKLGYERCKSVISNAFSDDWWRDRVTLSDIYKDPSRFIGQRNRNRCNQPPQPTGEPLVDALGNRKKPGQVFKNGHFIYPPGAEIK